jgi:hypothetical protein
VLDDERLKNPDQPFDYFDELLRRIQDIRTSERRFYQKITDIYATSVDYDPTQPESIAFFQTVQNKMHWAITGQTAAEIIHRRANKHQPNMGLTNWRGGKVRKADVGIAKNYLNADELAALNNLVEQYLVFAEGQAMRRVPMHMSDWIANAHDKKKTHDRSRPKATGQHPLEHCRPTARGDERGRLPRLHALLPVPALSVGQLRNGGAKGTGAGLPKLDKAKEGGDRRTPLAVWYAQNPDDTAEFEKQMRRKTHYVIQPAYLWGSIAEMARTQDGELLHTLQKGFDYIENESFASTFGGLFSEINLNSEKLGKATKRAMPSSAPSSRPLPRGWRSFPPTRTRWATPMNT